MREARGEKMGRYTRTDVTVGDVVKNDINVQLQLIETAIDGLLSKEGDANNSMNGNIDANSNDFLNVNRVFATQLYLNGQLVTDIDSTAPIVGTVDVATDYAWTGQHSFVQTPTVGGFDVYTTNTINTTTANVNLQTGTSYTAALTDRNGLINMSSSSSNIVTIPPNSAVALPTGTTIAIAQTGAGSTTIVAGAGVTLNHPTGLVFTTQYGMATAIKIDTDSWLVSGSLGV